MTNFLLWACITFNDIDHLKAESLELIVTDESLKEVGSYNEKFSTVELISSDVKQFLKSLSSKSFTYTYVFRTNEDRYSGYQDVFPCDELVFLSKVDDWFYWDGQTFSKCKVTQEMTLRQCLNTIRSLKKNTTKPTLQLSYLDYCLVSVVSVVLCFFVLNELKFFPPLSSCS